MRLGFARPLSASVVLALGLLCVGRAHAQAAPEAAIQHAEEVKVDVFQEDVTTLTANLGAAFNTGNTEAWQLNTGSDFALVRGRHGLGVSMAFAYGRANVKDDATDSLVDTVRNLKTRARYDFFLTPMDALFLAGVYRWDTFAGLDTRASGQVGYMRNFFKQEKHRFWGELGYDLTYDDYDPDPLIDMGTMAVLPGDDVVHSGRLFLGYDNQINEAVMFLTGIEGLLNVEDTDDCRIAWDSALRSAIGSGFQVELKFSLGMDTQPVPGTEKVDTTTLVTLLYTLL
jgi:putative salt-induced outer membrane protein YdiY